MTVLWQLFSLFFRIGLFSFGGGYAMLPMIYQGISDFQMMDVAEFSRLVALSQVTPGPIAVNGATYVGFQSAGLLGGAVATVAVALPSLILVMLALYFFERFQKSRGLQAVLFGIRPVSVALLLAAVVFLAEGSVLSTKLFGWEFLQNPLDSCNFVQIGFAVAVGVLHGKFKMSPIKLTVLAGILGAFLIRI